MELSEVIESVTFRMVGRNTDHSIMEKPTSVNVLLFKQIYSFIRHSVTGFTCSLRLKINGWTDWNIQRFVTLRLYVDLLGYLRSPKRTWFSSTLKCYVRSIGSEISQANLDTSPAKLFIPVWLWWKIAWDLRSRVYGYNKINMVFTKKWRNGWK